MINAKKVAYTIRHRVGDLNEVQYSDYDILYAINETLRYLSMADSLQNTDYLDAIEIYDEADYTDTSFATDGVALPDDFQILSGVDTIDDNPLKPCDISRTPNKFEYKVMGEKIYVAHSKFKLSYKKTIAEIANITTATIALPSFCFDIIVQIAALVLTKAETSALTEAVKTVTKQIIPRRKYNNAEVRMPFYC